VPGALRLTAALSPVLRPLDRALSDLSPMLHEIAPYGCNYENFGAVLRSMTGYGGRGTGPAGPAMAFRLQIVPSSPAVLGGAKDVTRMEKRDGYYAPCKYLASSYPAALPRTAARGK
jgi:hypothetical protein